MHSVAKNMSTMINFHIMEWHLQVKTQKQYQKLYLIQNRFELTLPQPIRYVRQLHCHGNVTLLIQGHTVHHAFLYSPYLNFCSSGGALDHQVRHLGRAIEHNFGPEQGARIWTSQPSKVQMPGGVVRGSGIVKLRIDRRINVSKPQKKTSTKASNDHTNIPNSIVTISWY